MLELHAPNTSHRFWEEASRASSSCASSDRSRKREHWHLRCGVSTFTTGAGSQVGSFLADLPKHLHAPLDPLHQRGIHAEHAHLDEALELGIDLAGV